MGAVIGTLAAELSACSVQYVSIRKGISIRKTLLHCVIYLLFGLVMIFAVRILAYVLPIRTFVKLILEILLGAITYAGLCFVFWKNTNNQMYKEVFGTMFGMVLKRFRH